MKHSKDLDTPRKIVARSRITNGTLGRIRNHEVNLGIDHLDVIAHLFKVESYELLKPDFVPPKPPPLALEEWHKKLRFPPQGAQNEATFEEPDDQVIAGRSTARANRAARPAAVRKREK